MPLPAQIQWDDVSPILTANTAKDGTGAAALIFEAKAETYVERIIFRPAGSNTASVGRVFINNGKNRSVAKNNRLISEVTLASTTLSEVAAMTGQQIDLDLIIPAGYSLYCTLGTTVAAGWYVTVLAGDYRNFALA